MMGDPDLKSLKQGFNSLNPGLKVQFRFNDLCKLFRSNDYLPEISITYRKFRLLTGNFDYLQEIFITYRKFRLSTGNFD